MHQKPSVLEVLSHPPAARRLAGVVNTNSVVRPPIEELAIIHTLYPDARGQRTLRTAATQDSMAGVVNTDSAVRPPIEELAIIHTLYPDARGQRQPSGRRPRRIPWRAS